MLNYISDKNSGVVAYIGIVMYSYFPYLIGPSYIDFLD